MPTNLTPKSQTSAIVLPSTGSESEVSNTLPIGTYASSTSFLSGAAAQVSYVYRKLGGDVVDIELTTANVYAAYEEAVLEYSYIINMHQAKNSLSTILGQATGTFDHKGDLQTGPSRNNLKYPRFSIGYSQRVGDGASTAAGLGGTTPIYSGSFQVVKNTQDYNLQKIIKSASDSGVDQAGRVVPYSGLIDDARLRITRVFYRSPRAMWRFYGYYGGVGVVGNYSTYGQFADDSTFEVIPTWQNKMQAIMYEDSIYTRTSHYSYEIKNNMLRLFPEPTSFGFEPLQDEIWFQFYIDQDAYATGSYDAGIEGINNINTVPFDNLPFININSMGQQWIRKYALALCKEMLGQIRGKFTTIPIPGESVALNHSELLSQAKEEQSTLKDKLLEMLNTLTYDELAKTDQELADAATNVLKISPLGIYVG